MKEKIFNFYTCNFYKMPSRFMSQNLGLQRIIYSLFIVVSVLYNNLIFWWYTKIKIFKKLFLLYSQHLVFDTISGCSLCKCFKWSQGLCGDSLTGLKQRACWTSDPFRRFFRPKPIEKMKIIYFFGLLN